MLPQPNLQKMEGVSPIPCEACSSPFSMAHLQDVHRKGVRRTGQTRQLPPTQTHFARRPCQSVRQRARVQFHVYESDKSEKCISRAHIVFSHLDGEICFSGRGSYSSLMKRASTIALVSIFPCKSNKLFGHGRRTASSWRGGGTREEKEIHPALAHLRAAGMYADVVAGWKDTAKFCFCRRRSVFAPKLFLMSFGRSGRGAIHRGRTQKFWGFWTPSPMSEFGDDQQY